MNFDEDWAKEMDQVSEGLADQEYCKKMGKEVPITARYLEEHGVKFNHHGQQYPPPCSLKYICEWRY